MKINIKIVGCLILVSLLFLLSTRQAGATSGGEGITHFPGIFFYTPEGNDCGPNHNNSSPSEIEFLFLFSLYQSIGDILIQNNAEIEIRVPSSPSEAEYFYYLNINEKRVSEISGDKILNNKLSQENYDNYVKHFFNYINDDVLRRFKKDKLGIKLEKAQFPVDGFTIQLGSFETKKEAVKFAKDLSMKLSMAVDKYRNNIEAKEDAYYKEHGTIKGFDYEGLFCISCLIQNMWGESEISIEWPKIFLKPYASNDWRVNFGLFIREEDANVAAKTVEKFYNGPSAIQKIKIDDEIIDKQTLTDCNDRFTER